MITVEQILHFVSRHPEHSKLGYAAMGYGFTTDAQRRDAQAKISAELDREAGRDSQSLPRQ